jgi:ribosome-binding protein aMBF1 (putative translation factor)
LRLKLATNQIDREIGDRIRIRRIQLGWTQLDLATKIYRSRAAIHRMELGDIKIGVSEMPVLAEVLNVKEQWLRYGNQ